MAYLVTLTDIKFVMYPEVADEITQDDNTIITEAIEVALAEAAGFLSSRYDVDKLLGTSAEDPTVTDKNLKSKVLDIVKWELVKMANPNIDYAAARENYEMAIANYFKLVQNGKIAPPAWPFMSKADVPTPADGLSIEVSSNPKRSQHF